MAAGIARNLLDPAAACLTFGILAMAIPNLASGHASPLMGTVEVVEVVGPLGPQMLWQYVGPGARWGQPVEGKMGADSRHCCETVLVSPESCSLMTLLQPAQERKPFKRA